MPKSSGIASCIVSVSSLIQVLSSIVCIVLYGATCLFVYVHCIEIVCIIYPLLYSVSSMYNLAILSSAHAFTHLLSSCCTSYFVPFHLYICAYCKCLSLVV